MYADRLLTHTRAWFSCCGFQESGLAWLCLEFLLLLFPSRKNTTALFTSPCSSHTIIRARMGALWERLQVTLVDLMSLMAVLGRNNDVFWHHNSFKMSMYLISYCGALTRRLVRVSCLGELKVKVRPKVRSSLKIILRMETSVKAPHSKTVHDRVRSSGLKTILYYGYTHFPVMQLRAINWQRGIYFHTIIMCYNAVWQQTSW